MNLSLDNKSNYKFTNITSIIFNILKFSKRSKMKKSQGKNKLYSINNYRKLDNFFSLSKENIKTSKSFFSKLFGEKYSISNFNSSRNSQKRINQVEIILEKKYDNFEKEKSQDIIVKDGISDYSKTIDFSTTQFIHSEFSSLNIENDFTGCEENLMKTNRSINTNTLSSLNFKYPNTLRSSEKNIMHNFAYESTQENICKNNNYFVERKITSQTKCYNNKSNMNLESSTSYYDFLPKYENKPLQQNIILKYETLKEHMNEIFNIIGIQKYLNNQCKVVNKNHLHKLKYQKILRKISTFSSIFKEIHNKIKNDNYNRRNYLGYIDSSGSFCIDKSGYFLSKYCRFHNKMKLNKQINSLGILI